MNDQPTTPERLAQAAQPLPPGVSAWPPGHRIDGFEFRGVVALRATAIVYRGWDHGLEVPVALKEYLPAALARRGPCGDIGPAEPAQAEAFERGLRAFIDEGRRLARCDHPSIARVLHLLPAHGSACLVMPWYGGRPLAELRREMSGPPDEPALRALLDALLAALHEWHRVNGVHGGLHPAGVLLLDDDRPLLLGPGYAGRAIARGGLTALEPGFSAPELDGDATRVGAWTDVYALAQLARFAITGLLPPPAGRTPEPLAGVVERLFVDHPSARYGAALLATLDAAVSPDIGARPQSIVDFAAWLAHGPPRRPAARSAQPLAPFSFSAADVPPGQAPDAATVDLIQRVIDTLPAAPPRREPAAMHERAAPSLEPPPRDGVAGWMLAAFALAAALGLGVWWKETHEAARPLPAAPAATAPAVVVPPPAATETAPSPAESPPAPSQEPA